MYTAEICRGSGISLLCRFLVPDVSKRNIGGDPMAGAVKIAQLQLRFSKPLLRRGAAPAECPFGILGCTLALQQHDGEIVLRVAVALLGRAAVPFDRLGEIADDAGAGAVHCRQLELRASTP